MLGFIMFVVWVSLVISSLYFNKDIFSPAKFYLLNIGTYFGLIFIEPYESVIYFYYLTFLVFGLIFIIIEPKIIFQNNADSYLDVNVLSNVNKNQHFILKIWLISFIPVLAQIYLIQYSGGIYSYINNIGLRVVKWQGMGVILELIKMFGVINLFYFSILLTNKKMNKKQWILYIIHFLIFVFIALLSGSRGALLWNVVFMLMLFHYLKKKLKLKKILIYIVTLLIFASVLGVARNGYKLTSEGFTTGLSNSEQSLDLKQFEYGIIPIELLYNVKNSEIEYGMTYLTPFTNIIPRKIWPNKPDTGGIIFTQRYTGDAWGGYSHLATGVIAEGVLNFGMFWGPIMGVIILFLVMIFVLKYYKKKLKFKITDIKQVIMVISYIYIVTSLPGLVKAEWTNVILDVVLKISKLWLIYSLIYFKPIKQEK